VRTVGRVVETPARWRPTYTILDNLSAYKGWAAFLVGQRFDSEHDRYREWRRNPRRAAPGLSPRPPGKRSWSAH